MESELIGAPKPILYNFKELSENAEYERENNVIGKERIDRLEIEQLFIGSKREPFDLPKRKRLKSSSILLIPPFRKSTE
jgi:hypothetical protein